jgi:hypothetical protein
MTPRNKRPEPPAYYRLRALNEPRPVRVEVGSDRLPRAVSEGDRSWTVETIGEVWRVDDEWWRAEISRRYVEVILTGGKHVALFEDLLTGKWYLQRM